MKKGFTLIELLAVLVLIGAISAIAFTSINGILERQKTKEYETKCNMFIADAETYFNDFKNEVILSDEEEEFTLRQLVENGYVKADIINPKTNQTFNLDQTTFNISEDDNGNYHFNEIQPAETWELIAYNDWCK